MDDVMQRFRVVVVVVNVKLQRHRGMKCFVHCRLLLSLQRVVRLPPWPIARLPVAWQARSPLAWQEVRRHLASFRQLRGSPQS